MKPYLILSLSILMLFPLAVSAQDDWEDIIYLKNGSVYHGVIIEQIPGVSYKIEIAGGSVIMVTAGEVEKITKVKNPGTHNDFYGSPDRKAQVFRYREKCFFFQGQIQSGIEFGSTLVFGYKFKHYAQLGLGAGVDAVELGIGANTRPVTGGYAPLFAYLGGDILKEKITPYYNAFAGYGFAVSGLDDGDAIGNITVKGGPMGGAGIGARFYSRAKWLNLILTANCSFQYARYWENQTIYNYTTYATYNVYSTGSAVLIIPTINMAIAF